MRLIVTGSSGTIGTRLCEKLLQRGDQVVGLDWVPNKWQPAVGAVTHLVDLRNESSVQALVLPENIDGIVHLAANARVYELVEHPDRARDNFLSTFNVLELARERGIKRFVFASSRECYGNIAATRYSENMASMDHCESPYTASKIGGEALVQSYARCYGIAHTILRFSNVYGMYDDSERIVPLFIRRARKNEPLQVFGDQKCLDFTYIDDAVDGILRVLDAGNRSHNETFNIAFGEGTTLTHVAERVKALTASTSTVHTGSSRTGEVIRYIADIGKARETLGFDPQTPFDTGIEKAVEWYGQHT